MRAALALVLALASVARAAPVVPPAGWASDDRIARSMPQPRRLDFDSPRTGVTAHVSPSMKTLLIVTVNEGKVDADQRDRIASSELAEIRDAMRRGGSAVQVERDDVRVVTATRHLEASAAWLDASTGLVASSRIVVAATKTHLVGIVGECLIGQGAAPDERKACEAALATLDPEIPVGERVPLAIVTSEPPPKLEPDVLNDGGKLALPPIVVDTPKPEVDRRPVYLGAGLVAFAALLYWSRKRREKFEREPEPELPPRMKPTSTDADADDLHTAAEASDDEERP